MRRFYRPAKGQSLIELSAGIIVLIPIVLLCIDACTVYMGMQLNTQVARDAARAAASGPPSAISPNQPQQRAQQVVLRSGTQNGAIRMEPQVVVTEQVTSLPKPPYGGFVDGTVTVQTTADVYPPFILGQIVGQKVVKLTSQQTFKYTWAMPSITNTSNNAPLAPAVPSGPSSGSNAAASNSGSNGNTNAGVPAGGLVFGGQNGSGVGGMNASAH